MANSDRFISLDKTLEDALEARLRDMGRGTSNPVHQYLDEAESEPVREQMDLCRQVRNLITHSADMGGHPPVEPSDELVDALEACIEYVRRPPLATSRMTPTEKLLRALESDRVKWLMKRMTEKGFSHAPVMAGNRLIGVFSVTTPFKLLMEGVEIDDQTRLREIMPFLNTDRHLTEQFRIIPPTITTVEASRLFLRASRQEKRVAALFVTEKGDVDSPLLGMLTPWDLMNMRHE